jgi:hypothetical protein
MLCIIILHLLYPELSNILQHVAEDHLEAGQTLEGQLAERRRYVHRD